jgi:predicted acetyltransferase
MDKLPFISFFQKPPETPGAFVFVDPGRLVDAELQLVAPDYAFLDDYLASAPRVNRENLLRFLATNPKGHDLFTPSLPVYHFWMRIDPAAYPPIPIAGTINLRIGSTLDIVRYYGHVGYEVFTRAQGRRYACRACKLLLPLARHHDLDPLWITCNPDNIPSRKTCEGLGARLVDTVPVPRDHPLYLRGAKEKCRYKLDL